MSCASMGLGQNYSISHKSFFGHPLLLVRAGLSKREALGLKQTRGPKNLLKFTKKSKNTQIPFFEKKKYKEYLQKHVLAIS